MLNPFFYRRFATLPNGTRIVMRFLEDKDKEEFSQLLRAAPPEDTQCVNNLFYETESLQDCLERAKSLQEIPLAAVDMDSNRLIATAILARVGGSAEHVGEIKLIFVSRPFQGQGVGSVLIGELIDLAAKINLKWLKAEVLADLKIAVKAFGAKGFERKAVLEDYFQARDGMTHDVILMTYAVDQERAHTVVGV